MNINGLYGNEGTKDKIADGITKISNKNSSAVPKESATRAKDNSYRVTINTVTEIETITYDEQILKESESILKNNEIGNKEKEESEEDRCKKNSDRMSEEDYKDLSEEGISLKKYTIESLERALTRIKNQRTFKAENIEDQKRQIEEKSEAIKSMAGYSSVSKKIVQKLISEDLPVTEENIIRVAGALELAGAATQMTDKAMSYLIKNNMEPTIENIYKAQYSGNDSPHKGISEEIWAGLEGQVLEIIKDAGLEINQESVESAKWLLNEQLPLTEESLWSLNNLKQIKNGINEEIILDRTVEALINGIGPESASLELNSTHQVEETMVVLDRITDEAINLTLQKNEGKQTDLTKDINFRQLKEAQEIVEEQKVLSNEIDIQTITIRRQLEEIRLRMTLESGQQLIKKGFHLETDNLSKITEGLKEIEDQYYSNLLKERNAPVTTETMDALKTSIQGMEELKTMPNYILGSTLPSRSIQTVDGLLAAGAEVKQTFEKANEAYESLMTSPRSDMGDSITKAFRNVDAILEDMKLDTTMANERAVRILGYNQMEITEDNINQIKAYDEQVNHLMKNLHPAVTVELIKKGLNPLSIPIEELNQQIDEIKKDLGVTDEEKYSKYLWKLEKQQGITEDEKQSYIGIYRLLNNVEKTHGAALGAVLKADQDVTMKNLLTAVRTLKSGGIEASVDDSFGALEQLTFSRDLITSQIEEGFHQAYVADATTQTEVTSGSGEDKFHYINSLLHNVMEEITPGGLKAVGTTEDIMNLSMEQLQENLQNAAGNNKMEQEYWASKLKDYQEILGQAGNAISLLEDYNIPSSLNNIQAAKDLLSEDQTFYKQWKNLLQKGTINSSPSLEEGYDITETNLSTISEGLMDSLTDKKSMKDQYDSLKVEVDHLLNQLYENPDISSQDIKSLQRINNGISFLSQLARRESYEIPISIGDSVTNVNVTIIRNTQETGRVDIRMNSEQLGKVSIGFSVKDNLLKGLITCDNRFGLEAMESAKEEINTSIIEAGIEVKQMNYGLDNRNIENYQFMNSGSVEEAVNNHNNEEGAVTTDTLYTIAKALLTHIKTIELRNIEN